MKIPYEEQPDQGIDINFEIIHFSYEQTEKSLKELNEFRKKEAQANMSQSKFDEKAP